MVPFKAPVVDALTIRVMVDSRYERFLPKALHPLVQIEHVGRIPGRELSTFAAEWGLSLHLSSTVDGAKAQYALDGPFTSGYIERTSFERVTGGTLVQEDHYSEEERLGKLVRDQHEDEHATCYIVNTVRSAMAAANVDRVHAVVGGFHLGMSPLPYLQSTLKEMEAIDPDVIVPMHCTGTAFIEMLRERMPEKLVYSNVGSRFTFGA